MGGDGVEAALYRSVSEKRSFLVVGRLEELPVPSLLGPRLRIDLLPLLEPGVTALVNAWQHRAAEAHTRKPVGAARTAQPVGAEPDDTIYIDSEQFGMTTPMRISLDAPAGMVLDQVISAHGLPGSSPTPE